MDRRWIQIGVASLPLATYPLWSRLLFYRNPLVAVATSLALFLILFRDRIPFARLLPTTERGAAFALGVVAYAAYAACAIGLLGEVKEFTGDEPNYLLATISLVQDRDIRLKNNFTGRDYAEIYPGRLIPRTTQGRDRGGYPVHGIAISAYLAPFYYIGSMFKDPAALAVAIRLGMALISATLAVAIFLLLRSLGASPSLAWVTSAMMALSPPLVNYSVLVYPETTAALIVAVFFRRLMAVEPGWCGCAFLISLCPWLGVKFNAIAAALGVLLLVRLVRCEAGARLRNFVRIVAAGAPSAVAYEAFLWRFYGSFSPAAAAGGRASGAKETVAGNIIHYFSSDTFQKLHFMPQTFLADLLDQKGGLLLNSPILIFAVYGIIVMARRPQHRTFLLAALVPAASHLGLYTYTNYLGGTCPPGRPLLPLLPLAALPLATGLTVWRNQFSRTSLLGAATVVAWLALTAGPMFFHDLIYSDGRAISNFAAWVDTERIRVSDYLPVLTVPGVYEWRSLALIAALGTVLLVTARWRWASASACGAGVAVVLAGVLWVEVTPRIHQRAGIGPVELQFLDGAPAYVERQGVWLRGSSAGRCRLVATIPLRAITFRVRAGERLAVTSGDAIVAGSSSAEMTIPLTASHNGPPYAHEFCFVVEGGFRPSSLDPGSNDRRWLGVYIAKDGITLTPIDLEH